MQVSVSILPVGTTQKNARKFYTVYKEVLRIPFEKLPDVLVENNNYSPFVYKHNTRLKENIVSNTNFVVLDIDITSVSIHDMHTNLCNELKTHILVTTSNSANLYKYRILLPLDRSVSKEEYPYLVKGIAEYGLVPDTDLQGSKNPSQTFFAYANAPTILTYFEGEALCVKDYLMPTKTYITRNSAILKDCVSIMETFKSPGVQKGTSTLVAASFEILKSGYTYEQYEKCLKAVNDSWVFPMDEDRLYTTVIRPFRKRFGK